MYTANGWGQAILPVTRIVFNDDAFVVIGEVEQAALSFVDQLGFCISNAEQIFRLCGVFGVDVYIHDASINIVWRVGQFGTPMFGDLVRITEKNPLKWGKYVGRLFNNVDHVVEEVCVAFVKLDLNLNDGGGIVSQQFLSRTFGDEYPEGVYYTYMAGETLYKGLAIVGETCGADFVLPHDPKGVGIPSMDNIIAVSAGHCHTRVAIDSQSLQNIEAIRPLAMGWLMEAFEGLKASAKAIPPWMQGAFVPAMVRKNARTLVSSIVDGAKVQIVAPLLRAYYRPCHLLRGDEMRVTVSPRTFGGHPALVLVEFSVENSARNLLLMGGGDYDDSVLVDIDTGGQVVMWRQPNAPGEYVVGKLVGVVDDCYTHEPVWDASTATFTTATVIETVIDGEIPELLSEAYEIASESRGMIGAVVNTIAILKDVMGRFPITMPSLEGIIGVQNKGKGRFSPKLKEWLGATSNFIEMNSEFISEFYWTKFSRRDTAWVDSGRGLLASFEDALLHVARFLVREFMEWVERNVVPFALPPREWVEEAVEIEDKGILGKMYGLALKSNASAKHGINAFRALIQGELRVFENMNFLSWRLRQHTVLSLFAGNAGWTATPSTKKQFGVSQIVKVEYNASPYNWGSRDFGISIKFFAHNWAISAGEIAPQKPSFVTNEDKGVLNKYAKLAEGGVWVGETLTFNNGKVFWKDHCVGLAVVPDGVYEGQVSFMHYFAPRDTAWVVFAPIKVPSAIVPAGFWDN